MESLQISGLWKRSWKQQNKVLKRSKNKSSKSKINPSWFKLPPNNQIPAQNFPSGLKILNTILKSKQAPFETLSRSQPLFHRHLSEEMGFSQMNFTILLFDKNTQIKESLAILTLWVNFDRTRTWSELSVMLDLWLLLVSFTRWDRRTMFITKSTKATCLCYRLIEETKISKLMKLQTELLKRRTLHLKTDSKKAVILYNVSSKAFYRKGQFSIK